MLRCFSSDRTLAQYRSSYNGTTMLLYLYNSSAHEYYAFEECVIQFKKYGIRKDSFLNDVDDTHS